MRRRRYLLARLCWPVLTLALGVAAAAPLAMAPATSAPRTTLADLPQADLSSTGGPGDYLIGPQDKLRIRVFQVKDLSFDDEEVDANGQIELPLIGKVQAGGRTTEQLRDDIARRLGEKYLQSPQVSVSVAESASLKVTVEGEVKVPGVYQIRGRTTLLQAIAMAGGPNEQADLHKVAVIREAAGVRKAAICDYQAVRDGRIGDPLIEGSDVVIVDGSTVKTLWSNVMKNLPIFTLFAYLR